MIGERQITAISSASCTTLRSCGRRRRELRERVQQLHDRGDRGVEGAAPADVVGHLGERLMRLAPDRALRLVEARRVERRRGPADDVLVAPPSRDA